MSQLFWLSTLVPGFALLQAVFPHDVRRGLLGTLTWSFVLTTALLTPIVVVAFLLHLTLATVGFLYLGLVALGLVGIARFSRWRGIRRSLRCAHWPELAVILVVIAVVTQLGGSATDDSFVHAAKVQYLREVGFSLQDPYSPLAVIESRYHVNTYQAIHAIASWISAEEPLDVWFRSAWFFRLLALGGIEVLAMAVFPSRWAGAVAMLAALGVIGTLKAIVYPNEVAAYLVFPLLLAEVLGMTEKAGRLRYLRIALGSLALGTIHVGYWLIVVMCLAPALLGWTIWRYWRGLAWSPGLLVAAALSPGAPFLLITALQANHVEAHQGLDHVWMVRVFHLGGNWTVTILDPTHYLWMLPAAAVMSLLLWVRGRSRARDLIMAAVFLAAALYMFTPLLFDLLATLTPYWMIRRARFIGEVIAYVAIGGGLAWMARRALLTRGRRVAFAMIVFCASLVVFRVSINDYYLDRARHHLSLQQARDLRETVRPVLRDRPLVAADPEISLMLPAVQVSAVMAPKLVNANPADGGVLRRQQDALELLAEGTPRERRREIVAAYGIDYVLTRAKAGEPSAQVFAEDGDLVAESHGLRLFRVRHRAGGPGGRYTGLR